MTSKSHIKITVARAEEMLVDFESLPLARHAMRPYQRRVLMLRYNLTVYDAFYVALAESLDMPLLTDDRKYAKASAHAADIETWA